MILMTSLRNHASLTSGIKKSSPITAQEKMKPKMNAILLCLQIHMSRSCEYMTKQTKQNIPMKQRWNSNTIELLPKIICRYSPMHSTTMYIKLVTMLQVKGRNLRYCTFHGRISIRANPIACVIAIVAFGSLTMQQSSPCQQNSIQTLRSSRTYTLLLISSIVYRRVKSIITSQLSYYFSMSSKNKAEPSLTSDACLNTIVSLIQTCRVAILTCAGRLETLTRN